MTEKSIIEVSLASGRNPGPRAPNMRRPWRSWAPPIFGNVFCPEDLQDHFFHQYHPQGHTDTQQEQQDEEDEMFSADPPQESLFCLRPILVVSPDGREVTVARQLKEQDNCIATKHCTEQKVGAMH